MRSVVGVISERILLEPAEDVELMVKPIGRFALFVVTWIAFVCSTPDRIFADPLDPPTADTGSAAPRAGSGSLFESYYSAKLRAHVHLEWMSMPRITFWGARIVGIDGDSPLHQLKLKVGDVISRLDASAISNGKYWVSTGSKRGFFALPESERHHGKTRIRFIRLSTIVVENGEVDLGSPVFPDWPPALVPVAPWPNVPLPPTDPATTAAPAGDATPSKTNR